MTQSPEERKALAREIAAEVLLHLGIDVDDKEGMKEFRSNLEFLKRMDRGAREVKSAAIKTCVGALITGLITLLLIGIRQWFSK